MSESLILIPDISGFTGFVNSTEISHSQHIISELLEIIIRSQRLGLEVAEVEGDAVLFYKSGDIPTLEEIVGLAENMFLQFHRHLKEYEHHRICNCGACSTAIQLSLKIVVHKSEIGFTDVNNRKKPFGPGIILAHRLLKNSIKESAYLLFSSPWEEEIKVFTESAEPNEVFITGKHRYSACRRTLW